MIEEKRDEAVTRVLAYRQRAARYFNKRVKPRGFAVGDLVLRNATAAGHTPGKLDPNWEGPFEVDAVIGRGSYRLKTLEGKPLNRPWNASNLKRYYQ